MGTMSGREWPAVEDTGGAALTFTWWGLFILLYSENESSLIHANWITSYSIWLTLSNLECHSFLHITRTISLGFVPMCVSVPGITQGGHTELPEGSEANTSAGYLCFQVIVRP